MQISFFLIAKLIIILLFSLILSVQDIKHGEVSVYIQWVSIFCALLCHLIFARTEMWIYIISSMLMGAFYFTVRKITREKLGPADVWFGFFQGLFLVPMMIPLCFGIEALAAFCVMNKKVGRKTFPFIPFMSLGLIITYVIASVAKQSM